MIKDTLSKYKVQLIFSILIIILGFLVIVGSRVTTPTIDEMIFVSDGVSFFSYGDLSCIQHGHLTHLLTALPLTFLHLNIPERMHNCVDYWNFGYDFYNNMGNSIEQIKIYSRFPIFLLSLILGIFVFIWAKKLYGKNAALLALFLFTFNPVVLSYAQLATHEIALTLFAFLSIFCLWKFHQQPSKKYLFLTGLFLTCTLLTKPSSLLMFPIFILLQFFYLRNKKEKIINYSNWKNILYIFLIAVGLLILFYISLNNFGHLSSHQGLHTTLDPLVDKYIPGLKGPINYFVDNVSLPGYSYIAGMMAVAKDSFAEGYPAFLMGNFANGGWWYYFITAFLIKNPIPLLIFIGFSLLLLFKKREFDEIYLLLPAGFFLLYFSFSEVMIGIRYILPIFPFLIVFATKFVRDFEFKKKAYKIILAILMIWYVISLVFIFPYYFGYFNEIAGGTKNGYKFMADSSNDWGQGLKVLKEYVDKNNITNLKLSYFGSINPSSYGINYTLLPISNNTVYAQRQPFNEDKCGYIPGIVAVSVTNLQSTYMSSNRTCYTWLKENYKPISYLDYSIFVYNVTEK